MFKKAYNIIEHNYDVIVVGAGGAGLRAARLRGAAQALAGRLRRDRPYPAGR